MNPALAKAAIAVGREAATSGAKKAAPLVAMLALVAAIPATSMLTMSQGANEQITAANAASAAAATPGLALGACAPDTAPVAATTKGALDPKVVAQYAKAAGFPDDQIGIAVAVATAESGLKPTATNRNTNGSTDFGLWQINSIHASVLSQGTWSDPADNAVMAFKIWQQAGNSWTPWVTFKTGAYQKYMTLKVVPEPADCTPLAFTAAASTCSVKVVDFSAYANGMIPRNLMCPIWAKPNLILRSDAAGALEALSKAYIKQFGAKPCITDAYRSLPEQIDVKRRKPFLAAKPGTSNHGWGQAIDMCGGIENFGSAQHAWMKANAGRFGWKHPSWAQIGGSKPEPWHWEYGVVKKK